MLRIIQFYHSEYYRGRLTRTSRDVELSALWIASSIPDNYRSRAGPIVYPFPVPQPIMYGSLGTFLASMVAEQLGIARLLDHHSDGLINNSVILGLGVQLNELVKMYSEMDILTYGSEVYKAQAEETRDQQLRDHLTLKLSFKAWKQLDRDLESDHFIPGLTFTRPQLFFIAFAQTQCEKVSDRGILKYYVEDKKNPAMPTQQRVNGVLRNSVDFAEAFQCSDNKYMNSMDKIQIFG
ncbi:endothelin-converting enzyme-like 1 [Physella acuta]|uniref:endothelin-converting enzyme-like 1 n=1 Tax=Physella acuta TaxID=109671 RepID=UPI0027DE7613|nr:endothelin-converting enzyme-like 1 [Physella acuta]